MPFCIAPCSVHLFCSAVGTEKQRGCNFEAHVYHVRYRLDCISSLLVYSLSCLTWSYTSARWRQRAPKIFIYEDKYDVRASQSYNLFVSQSQQHGEKLAHADGGHRWETLNAGCVKLVEYKLVTPAVSKRQQEISFSCFHSFADHR